MTSYSADYTNIFVNSLIKHKNKPYWRSNSIIFIRHSPGLSHLIKYISAGLTIDLLHYILKNHNTHYIKAVIGASSYAVSFTSLATLFILIGINTRALKLGFPYVLTLHVAFGALAGFISYLIINIVEKAKFCNL